MIRNPLKNRVDATLVVYGCFLFTMQRYYIFHWRWCILGLFNEAPFSCELNRAITCQLNRASSCELNRVSSCELNRVFSCILNRAISWELNRVFSCHGSPRYSIINRTCLVVRFCLWRNGTLRASKAATNSGQLSIQRSNAFTAMRGLLSGKYRVAKSRRFIFYGEL